MWLKLLISLLLAKYLTVSANISPDAFCANVEQAGSYKNENDPTCRTFIYCLQSGTGPKMGFIYDCSTKKPYFSGKACQADPAPGCKSVQTNLTESAVHKDTTMATTSEEPGNIDPDTFCTNVGTGYYRNQNDATCRTFIFCSVIRTEITAHIFECSSKKPYFYGRACQAEKPVDCI